MSLCINSFRHSSGGTDRFLMESIEPSLRKKRLTAMLVGPGVREKMGNAHMYSKHSVKWLDLTQRTVNQNQKW